MYEVRATLFIEEGEATQSSTSKVIFKIIHDDLTLIEIDTIHLNLSPITQS